MSKSLRNLLFILSVVAFIAVSYLMVLFALGYKYDFEANTFFETGAIKISTNIDSDVYINEEYSGNTSFFNRSFTKSSLLPKKYKLKVVQDQYRPWEKEVLVQEGLLSEFDEIFLVRASFSSEIISSPSMDLIKFAAEPLSEDMIISPNNRVGVKVESDVLYIFWLEDNNNQPFQKKGRYRIIACFR